MNSKMRGLLQRVNSLPESILHYPFSDLPALVRVDGSVYLESQYRVEGLPNLVSSFDETDRECFVNHVHFELDWKSNEVAEVFPYISGLYNALALCEGAFEIIASFSEDGAVVRFHQHRPTQLWLASDLEGYAEEAILAIRVESQRPDTSSS